MAKNDFIREKKDPLQMHRQSENQCSKSRIGNYFAGHIQDPFIMCR